MEGFRQLIKGWLGKFLLGVVVFVFVIYGAESLMVIASRPKPVAEVNGDEISREALDRRVEQYRRAQISRLGEGAKDADLSNETLAPQTLQIMVDRVLLTQRIKELSMAASEFAAKKWIASMPEFQQNGQFSDEIFKVTLARAGYTPRQLIQEVQSDHALRQLQQGVVDSYFMTENEVSLLMALQEQARDLRFAVVSPKPFVEEMTVDANEIENYYQSYQADFEVEQQAKFQYVQITSDQFESEVEVTEEDLKLAYQSQLAEIEKSEQRRASHILIASEPSTATSDAPPKEAEEDSALEKIRSIQKQLQEGADFAALAKQYSMDPGSKDKGGDLGFTQRGVMVDSFDQALFALEEGAISDIIETEFGYHLIKLHEIKVPEKPEFESIKETLEAQVRSRKAQDIFSEKVDELNRLAYESGDLVPLVDAFGVEIKFSDWMFASGGEGVFADESLLKAAFSDEVIKDGFNTDAITIGNTAAIVLRLSDFKPSYVKPLAEVKEEITQAVKLEKAQNKAVKVGREILAQLRAGKSSEEVLKAHSLTWREQKAVKRFSMVLPRPVVQKAFEMPHPQPQSSQLPFDGTELDKGFAVIELQAVKQPETEMSEDEVENMRQFLTQQMGQLELDRYLEYHKLESDIEINL